MLTKRISMPEGLLQLKPSEALESMSMSRLARTGTAVLWQITSTAQPVAVKVQGQGAVVILSQHLYDEMVEFIRQLQEETMGDGFALALAQRFDALVAQMSGPGAARATSEALFGDPTALLTSYQPGATESVE